MSKVYGLKKYTHKKFVREFVDIDYISKLSELDKLWLNQFLDEYYDLATYKYKGQEMHNTPALRKALGDADNARRRDVFAVKGVLRTIEL